MSEYLKDLAEQTAKTFVGAALAVVPANLTQLTDLGVLKGVGVAGLVAAGSMILGVLAKWSGSPDNASFRK